MANTLTSLIPTIYTAADTVARELTGFIPAVTRNSTADRAALNETILYPVVAAFASADISAAATGPDPSAVTVGNGTMSITKSKSCTFFWEGEEQKGLKNAGYYAQILQDQFSQAMRTLTNEVEADLAALQAKASRAYGTAATTPFGTANDYTAAANVRKILKDNGTPDGDLQLVIDTAAGANLRGKQALVADQAAGSILRQGVLLDINGFAIRESAQVVTSTAGAMASATTSAAAFTVGQTVLPLATAGTGVVAAGDIITLANDTNQYVITSVSFAGANPASGDSITIAAPGLRKAQGSATRAITVVAAAARNMAFHRSAIHLLTRVPAMPEGGDSADDVLELTDPLSGLAYQVCLYRQRRRVAFEVGLAWGVKAVKPEFTGLLLG